jgi:hypothetical protein
MSLLLEPASAIFRTGAVTGWVPGRQTRRTGQFDYRVALPGEVDAENVKTAASTPH